MGIEFCSGEDVLCNGVGAMNGIRTFAVAALLIAAAIPARAQVNAREPDPTVWLREICDLYHRMEKSSDPAAQPTYELVEKERV